MCSMIFQQYYVDSVSLLHFPNQYITSNIYYFYNMHTSQAQSPTKVLPSKPDDDANKSPIENLTIQEIQKILDDMNVDQNQKNIQNLDHQNINNTDQPQPQINANDSEDNSNDDQLTTKDVIISKSEIVFGNGLLLPGSIEEIDFSVNLSQNDKGPTLNENQQQIAHMLRIIVLCRNTEFDSLDEYVFSVRSNNYYEYYEQVRFKIRRGEKAQIKVAVKMPSVKQNYVVHGQLEVRLENLQPILVPIVAKCVIPQIICLKTLYKEDEKTTLIKVPAKKCQQRTPPIPFKNLSPFNLSLQIEAISNQNFTDKPYDITTQNFVSCQANGLFFVNMQLKQNINFVEPFPSRFTIRKVLVLKVKNSSSFFHFPLEINVFEGQAAEGN